MVQWLQPILTNVCFQAFNAPTPMYEDIQPTIDITKENHITIRFKHITVTIHYVYEQYFLLNIDPVSLKPLFC